MAEKIITIIGCGPGGADYLTPIAKKRALQMNILAGASRLFDLFPEFTGKKIIYKGTKRLLNTISSITGNIGILVSGDTTYFSLAESIVKRFGIDNCELIPGISSIQVALSHFGLKSNTAKVISSHAAVPDISPESLTSEESIVLLGGNPDSKDWILTLALQTSKSHILSICIDLTMETEQIVTLQNPTPETLKPYLKFSRLILIFHRII